MHGDERLGAVILRGAGERAFCAGADFDALTGGGTAVETHSRCWKLPSRMRSLPCRRSRSLSSPWWGAPCFGGGVQLALTADIRIASADARFGVPAAILGIVYPVGAIAEMIRAAGPVPSRNFCSVPRRSMRRRSIAPLRRSRGSEGRTRRSRNGAYTADCRPSARGRARLQGRHPWLGHRPHNERTTRNPAQRAPEPGTCRAIEIIGAEACREGLRCHAVKRQRRPQSGAQSAHQEPDPVSTSNVLTVARGRERWARAAPRTSASAASAASPPRLPMS